MQELEKSVDEDNSPAFGFFTDMSEMNENEVVGKMTGTAIEQDNESQAFGFFDDSFTESTVQSAEHDSESNIISLGTELTIRSVASCKALIDKNINSGFDVKLAAGDLQKIDSAGLQMIYSLNKTMEKNSQPVQWVSTSSIINQSARLMGMQNLVESNDEGTAFGFFNETGSTTPKNQQENSSFGFF